MKDYGSDDTGWSPGLSPQVQEWHLRTLKNGSAHILVVYCHCKGAVLDIALPSVRRTFVGGELQLLAYLVPYSGLAPLFRFTRRCYRRRATRLKHPAVERR
jgi:hypothetical protein